jgi:hypothetical protein
MRLLGAKCRSCVNPRILDCVLNVGPAAAFIECFQHSLVNLVQFKLSRHLVPIPPHFYNLQFHSLIHSLNDSGEQLCTIGTIRPSFSALYRMRFEREVTISLGWIPLPLCGNHVSPLINRLKLPIPRHV